MTESVPSAVPRVLLGAAWVLAAVGVGVIGWLVFALSEHWAGRVAGVLLVVVALLGIATAALLLTGRRDGAAARRLSLGTSAAFALAGVVAAVLVALDDRTFLSDVLLLGGVPVACAVGTALLAQAGRR